MSEIQLYEGVEFPFTREWYAERWHSPHLDQPIHHPRMYAVQAMVRRAVNEHAYASVVDLGAGDGGTLSLIGAVTKIPRWGYDLMPPNVDYAVHTRRQDVRYADFLNEPIDWGELVVCTEVLEHLEDPHGLVRRVRENAKALIATSPSNETVEWHDGCHAWIWDMDGYRQMLEGAGFEVAEHEFIDGEYQFQVILGV